MICAAVCDVRLQCVICAVVVCQDCGLGSLTGTEPVWFEMENSLPNCVKKA